MSDTLVTALYYLGSTVFFVVLLGLVFWQYIRSSPDFISGLLESVALVSSKDHDMVYRNKLAREVRALKDDKIRREKIRISNEAWITAIQQQIQGLEKLQETIRTDEGIRHQSKT